MGRSCKMSTGENIDFLSAMVVLSDENKVFIGALAI